MVIQCSSCDTRFKLADDKLKPGGVKVRCSKCKEVFTVMPPDEEETAGFDTDEAPGTAANDWSDLSGDSGSETEGGADGMDWSDIGSDSDDEGEGSLSFSMDDDDDDASDGISFGSDSPDMGGMSMDDTQDDTDSISFDDAGSDSISFDDTSEDSDVSEDDFGFSEPVGGGAQDEFSFDEDEGGGLETSDDAPDFDWDGGADDDSGSSPDDFDFGDAGSGGDDLDFSTVAIEKEETPPPPPAPAPLPIPDEIEKPLSAKGPQKGSGKRSRKQKKVKKKGPLRGLMLFIFFLLLLAGAHAGVLYWKGYWKGDPNELMNLDHQTVHLQVYQELYAELTGGKVNKIPEGAITVLNMGGRFVENSAAGTIFVIEGQVKNDFKETRSAIAVRGLLFDQTGKPVMRKNAYCGNKLSEAELKTLTQEEINERLGNQFGDSLSNLDVAPGVVLPYTIVFTKLPSNLSEYNVEVAESTAGSPK